MEIVSDSDEGSFEWRCVDEDRGDDEDDCEMSPVRTVESSNTSEYCIWQGSNVCPFTRRLSVILSSLISPVTVLSVGTKKEPEWMFAKPSNVHSLLRMNREGLEDVDLRVFTANVDFMQMTFLE